MIKVFSSNQKFNLYSFLQIITNSKCNFRIPKCEKRREVWLNEIRKHQEVSIAASYVIKLCALHFEQRFLCTGRKHWALKKDAVPTIFNDSTQIQIKAEENDSFEITANSSLPTGPQLLQSIRQKLVRLM